MLRVTGVPCGGPLCESSLMTALDERVTADEAFSLISAEQTAP